MERLIWDVIAVTGWTLPQITALTLPQLRFVQRGRGRILYPRLEPMIQANLANLSDRPGADGEPSPVEDIIHRWQASKAGLKVPLTPKEERFAYAKRILQAQYLGDPDAVETVQAAAPSTRPYPGMGRDEAEAWISYVGSGRMPDFVWLEIQGVYPNIRAAAQQSPR